MAFTFCLRSLRQVWPSLYHATLRSCRRRERILCQKRSVAWQNWTTFGYALNAKFNLMLNGEPSYYRVIFSLRSRLHVYFNRTAVLNLNLLLVIWLFQASLTRVKAFLPFLFCIRYQISDDDVFGVKISIHLWRRGYKEWRRRIL